MDLAHLVPAAGLTVTRALRQPLLHFLVLGGLLLAAQRTVLHDYFPDTIVIPAGVSEQLRARWQTALGRDPSEREWQASLQSYVDEEILLREALRQGLDEDDPVARERLLRNIRFAFPGTAMDESQQLRAARRLGMAEQDVVVRRRLGIVMEKRIAGAVPVTDAALQDYLARHADRYQSPQRYRWQHLFFDGPDASVRAQNALQRLHAGQPAGASDAFLGGTEFTASTERDMRRILGLETAEAIVNAAPGLWQGPLVSAYGVHLVRVEERMAPTEADWAALRPQLAYALLPELEQAAVKAELQRLRASYRVEMAP